MKIFQRALIREFAGIAGAVFLTLFAIALTVQLIRLLGNAAGGKIPSDAVLVFLAVSSVGVLPVLLSLTLFVSVLMTFTRSYQDSEMIVWFSLGLPLTAWLRPVLTFAIPVAALIGVLSLVITPWVSRIGEQYRTRVEARDDVARVTPGEFGESASRDRVFFVESLSGDQTVVYNVFVSLIQHRTLGVVRSERGHTETAPNGDRFLVLERGRRYEGEPGTAAYRVMEFDRYAARIEAREARQPQVTHRQRTTFELLERLEGANRGELLWRVGFPLSALVLAVLAIPLGYVNPRGGRSVNLVYALLIYITYANLLSVTEASVSQHKLDLGVGVALVHVVMLIVAVALFAYRMQVPRR